MQKIRPKIIIDELEEWWNNDDWWKSKGYADIDKDIGAHKVVKDKYKMIEEAIKKYGGAVTSTAINANAGGIGAVGSNTVGPAGGSQAMGQQEVKFSIEAKKEILEVKESIKRLCTLQHLPKNSIIAGGVFVSLFHKEPVNDIDVFVLGSKDDDQLTLPELTKPGKYSTMKNFENYTGRSDIIAIFNDTETKFQYIYTRVKSQKELLEGFDYLHCCCSFYDDKLWISPKTYDAIKNKWLIENNTKTKIKREEKFLERGFISPQGIL